MLVFINNQGEIVVKTEDTDQCIKCQLDQDCPLINALYTEVATLTSGSLEVNNCGLYCPEVEETIEIKSFWDRLRVSLRILFKGDY